MRDAISIQRIALLHPKVRQEAIDAIDEAEAGFPNNMAVRVAQGFRTAAEQDALYALGRTKVNPDGKSAKKPMGNIVTKAQSGKSLHELALALDFCIVVDTNNDGKFDEVSWDVARDLDKDGVIDWQEVVKAFDKRGWEWGGRWRTIIDRPHVQKTFGLTLAQLKAKPKKDGYIVF